MKHKRAIIILLTLLLILATLVACKPKELPNYSNVIETVPEHILEVVESMKDKSGIYVFDSEKFGTDPNTYIAIVHSEKEKTMVTIGELSFGDNDDLLVNLIETTASSDRDYSIIKIENFTENIVFDNEQNYETIDTEDLYITSKGSIHSLSDTDVIIGINSFPITLKITEKAGSQIEESNISTNDEVFFEYVINNDLKLMDIQKIISQGELNGIFIGYIDSHTVEIQVNEDHYSYQVNDEMIHKLNQEDVSFNQEITFSYIEFDSGQKILTEIN